MKKIAILLWVMIGSLGVNAQPSVELRNHKNPTIDGLVEYAESLGHHIITAYANYGIYRKVQRINIEFRSDSTYMEGTNGSESESQIRGAMRLDSIFAIKDRNSYLMLDSIRQAYKELSKVARESNMWESHENGTDSVSYAISLGRPSVMIPNKNTETITFIYKQNKQSLPIPHTINGYANFTYDYHTDSIWRPYNDELDASDIMKDIEKICTRDGARIQHFTVYNDKTHDYTGDLFSGVYTKDGKKWNSETTGVLCIASSIEIANQIIDDIYEATWAYLDEHPHVGFDFAHIHLKENTGSLLPFVHIWNNHEVIRVEPCVDRGEKYDKQAYCIMVRQIKGTEFLPKGWSRMKSYNNGKYEYYDSPITE